MFCPYCGSVLPENSNECTACGAVSYVSTRKRRINWFVLIPAVILSVVFVAGIVLVFLNPGSQTSASGSYTTSDTCFELNNGVLYFDAEKYSGGRVLTVPDKINGQAVTAIGEKCFYDCDELTTIILPEGILSIGRNAFAECDNLRGMNIPETVSSIGARAFYNCPSFEAIYIPVSVTSIGTDAFDQCCALRYLFYYGYFEEWDSLYNEFINPFATAVCLDGYYYHGVN